jgi:hypothetical protein
MKNGIETGGPAFPNSNGHDNPNYPSGMTLRDWFAGQALAGWMAHPEGEFSFQWTNSKGETRLLGYGVTPAAMDAEGWRITRRPDEAMALCMYGKADAMIAERDNAPKTADSELLAALKSIEDHHGETDDWREIARSAVDKAEREGCAL